MSPSHFWMASYLLLNKNYGGGAQSSAQTKHSKRQCLLSSWHWPGATSFVLAALFSVACVWRWKRLPCPAWFPRSVTFTVGGSGWAAVSGWGFIYRGRLCAGDRIRGFPGWISLEAPSCPRALWDGTASSQRPWGVDTGEWRRGTLLFPAMSVAVTFKQTEASCGRALRTGHIMTGANVQLQCQQLFLWISRRTTRLCRQTSDGCQNPGLIQLT